MFGNESNSERRDWSQVEITPTTIHWVGLRTVSANACYGIECAAVNASLVPEESGLSLTRFSIGRVASKSTTGVDGSRSIVPARRWPVLSWNREMAGECRPGACVLRFRVSAVAR